MQLGFALLFIWAASAAHGQAWEKRIAPGLSYRVEVDATVPRIVHILRYAFGSPSVVASPELAQGKVYAADPTKGRETIGDMVRRTGAIAAVNGDFFPYTGHPLGTMVRNGRLTAITSLHRAAFGWGSKSTVFGFCRFKGSLARSGDFELPIDGLNEECGPNRVVLNTPDAGLMLAKSPNVCAVITIQTGTWAPTGEATGKVEYILPNAGVTPIAAGSVIVAAGGAKGQELARLRPGDQVKISLESTGFDWSTIRNVIGGGPILLSGGRVAIDAKEEGFDAKFSDARHSRTAIGRTARGDILIVATDGRQLISVGNTLPEMAKIMRRLGCVDAMNLDGGASTTMNLFGLTLNRPSDGVERTVANGLVLYGPKPESYPLPFTLTLPSKIAAGDKISLKLLDAVAQPIANADILWAATGQAWVDQGGTLRALGPGKATVSAFAEGRIVRHDFVVAAATRVRGRGFGVRGSGLRAQGSGFWVRTSLPPAGCFASLPVRNRRKGSSKLLVAWLLLGMPQSARTQDSDLRTSSAATSPASRS